MHDRIVATYKHLRDIAYLMTTLQNPVPRLMKQMPTISKLKTEWDIDSSLTSYSQEQQEIIDELQELLGPERKAFVDRKSVLKQNIYKIYGQVWRQCTPKLKEDICVLTDYPDKSKNYDCIWLINVLKSSSSGAYRSQYDYLSLVCALRSLLTCRQQDNKSAEGMSEWIASLMQNLKLIGGDVCFDAFVKKETAEYSALIPEAALTRVEDKFLGVLMIEASNDRKYGEMRRSLHNSMAEGHNRYPPNKATAYTMIGKSCTELRFLSWFLSGTNLLIMV